MLFNESIRRQMALWTVWALFLNLLILALPQQTAKATGKFSQSEEIQSAQPTIQSVQENLVASAVRFEINQGQFDERVRFQTRNAAGYTLFLTADEAVYVLPLSGKEKNLAYALRMKIEGVNRDSAYTGETLLEGKTNYFKGWDQTKWRTDVPSYAGARYENVYPGIDMVWKNAEMERGATQYDFVVEPGARTEQIRLRFDGARSLELDAEGNLLINTAAGVLRQNRPFSYQDIDGVRRHVESNFVIDGEMVSFNIDEYDRTKTLTIDPMVDLSKLAYSTFLGETGADIGYAIAVDNVGNVYVTGTTSSASFPTRPGAYDTMHSGTVDAFVTKFNTGASELLYSTYIGGNARDEARGIAIDSAGNAFITGWTEGGANPDRFPTTPEAFDEEFNSGGSDAFVTKLNATGSALLYSTFIGGNEWDEARSIAIKPNCDPLTSCEAFVTGWTGGGSAPNEDYPTTKGAFQPSHSLLKDSFVTGLNAAGTALSYSTYLGGRDNEEGNAIAVDLSGNVVVTGFTACCEPGFPTTVNAYDRIHNGSKDVFVSNIAPSISGVDGLLYSTLVGGSSGDEGKAIVVDSAGDAFVTGLTNSGTPPGVFPTTPNVWDPFHNGGSDVFVTKLNLPGTVPGTGVGVLHYSTFIGGSSSDEGSGIDIDPAGNAFVTGITISGVSPGVYPTTIGAFDTSYNEGGVDVFVTKLNSTATALSYSTFIGGTNQEFGNGIAVDVAGSAFVTGWTDSGNSGGSQYPYPSSSAAFDKVVQSSDAFITKLGPTNKHSDFDGDGRTDLSIFRPGPGEWWYQRSYDSQVVPAQFGASTDKIVPGDFTGDGKTDIAVWRPSDGYWNVLRSEDGAYFAFPFGSNGDIPAPADYDGDGRTDPAVFRPTATTWFISNSGGGGTSFVNFGTPTDKPVVADYDGDSKADIAIWRSGPGEWWGLRSSNSSVFALQFGATTDRPVQGDYTGDGKADIAFWRPADGNWFILRSEDNAYLAFPFGSSGDVPVPGDYDGDGRQDSAVFRPTGANWFLNRSTAGVAVQQFGLSTDTPIPSVFVP